MVETLQAENCQVGVVRMDRITLSANCVLWTYLTLSPPIPLRLYTLPYWSNPPFSGLSARAPECQKLEMVGYTSMALNPSNGSNLGHLALKGLIADFSVLVLQDLSYRDKHWHDMCFKCGSCSTSLINESFAFKNDQLCCAHCYEQMFAPRCTKCKQVFRPGLYVHAFTYSIDYAAVLVGGCITIAPVCLSVCPYVLCVLTA